MPVADDVFIDYTNEFFYHIDGRLSYQNNTDNAPSFGDYVIGSTSGAVSKVVAGSDLGGTSATGTIDVTETRGVWASGEEIRVLSSVNFDTVANGGFAEFGITITGPTTESIDVQAVEYNWDTALPGEGYIYGDNLTTGFADDEQLDVSGGTSAVALVHTGAETDNSALFAGADITTDLTVPGTADTNDSVIIHFDTGIDAAFFPVDSIISDNTTGAIGKVAELVGDPATTGSIRLVNSDTTGGAWTNNNTIDQEGILQWDNPTGGEVFQVGDIIQGSVSGTEARVLSIIDDGGGTGAVVTADETGAGWDAATPDLIRRIRRGGLPVTTTTIAEVEDTTFTRTAGTLNASPLDFQRADQGGIYVAAESSINIVRNSNEVYTHMTGEFDDLAQLDDDYPVRADGKDLKYTMQGGWQWGTRSFSFMNSGAWLDETGDNVWTNDQSIMAANNIGNHGFLYDATNPTPQPDLYCVQNSAEVVQFWMEGAFNVLILTRTKRDTTVIDPAVNGLGQDIDGGSRAWNLRPYLSTYDYFVTSVQGTVNPIPLNNGDDGQNTTGTHDYDYNSGTGTPFDVGEIIQGGTSGARAIVVTAGAGATGTFTYALLTATNFQDTETVTGDVSGDTAATDGAGGDTIVAGYGTDIRAMVVSSRMTGGTTAVATPIVGEEVSQGANVGYLMQENPTNTLFIEEHSGTWDGTTLITGDESGFTYTPTTRTLDVDYEYDIGDGLGDDAYSGMVSGNLTGGSARTATEMHEWLKYITAETALAAVYSFKTRGTGDGGTLTDGNQYLQLFAAAGLEKSTGGPVSRKPGAVIIGAVGWVFDKDTLDSGDIRNVQLFANDGDVHNAPNLQNLQWTGLVSGDSVAIFRATGAAGGGSTSILRTQYEVGVVGTDNQAADSIVLVQAGDKSVSPLASDIPDTGVLYVEDPSNPTIYLRMPYNVVDRTNNQFTLTSGTIGAVTGGSDLTQTDNVHVAPVSKTATSATESNALQYVADEPYVWVFRLKGELPQRTAGDFSVTGGSVGAAHAPDAVVNLP